MRPDMRDSLTSGQPLYLLYSYSNFGAPGGAVRLLVLLPMQAMGRVRLQVTGSPPTTRASDFLPAHPRRPKGSAVAAMPCSTRLRDTQPDDINDSLKRADSQAPQA